MTREYHIKQHEILHKALDELAADFLKHNRDKLLSNTTIMDLLHWSCNQIDDPTE